MSNKNDHDTYIIPPNFIETGTFFGGMFRARNVIEAGILVFAIGAPVFLFLPFGLTTRIIILCLTALPAGLVALIGISGESLSQFLVIFLKYLRNRRVVGGDGAQPEEKAELFSRSAELLEALQEGPVRTEEEAGDLLFAAVNVVRLCGVHAETALMAACEKFIRRFRAMEQAAVRSGITLSSQTLETLDGLWEETKRLEKQEKA